MPRVAALWQVEGAQAACSGRPGCSHTRRQPAYQTSCEPPSPPLATTQRDHCLCCRPVILAPPLLPPLRPQANTHRSEPCRMSWSASRMPWPHASCTCCGAQADTDHTHTHARARCKRKVVFASPGAQALSCRASIRIRKLVVVWEVCLPSWLAGWLACLLAGGLRWGRQEAACTGTAAQLLMQRQWVPDTAPARRAS